MVRLNQTGDVVLYDELYDSLVQFKPHLLASKAKKAAKNHVPLALLAHSNAFSPQPYYTPQLVSEPGGSRSRIYKVFLCRTYEDIEGVEKTVINTSDDDQIDSNIIFDDPYVENNGGTSEHDSNAHDEYHDIQMLAYNVQREAKNQK
ncbi:hypothetical protein Tco_1338244 [Tanacetum coccineum]